MENVTQRAGLLRCGNRILQTERIGDLSMELQRRNSPNSRQIYCVYPLLTRIGQIVSIPSWTTWTAVTGDTGRQPHVFRNQI